MSDLSDRFGLLEHIGLPAFVLSVQDGSARYAWWNSLCAARAPTVGHDVAGLTAVDIFGGRLGRRARDQHDAVARSGEGTKYRVVLPTVSGERVFQTTLTPLRTDGVLTHIIGISTDISRLEEAAEEDSRRLLALEEAEFFIAMAAHDLRAPMRNVAIVAESLVEDLGEVSTDVARSLDMLIRIAQRTSRTVREVLAHAQATTSRDAPVTAFNLVELSEELVDVLDPQNRHDIDCAPAMIAAERITLRIILQNLLDNALKHAGRDEISLRIAVEDDADSRMLRYTVTDNGKGFADPALAFLDGGEARYDSGFGLLGLRRLIEARGGSIAAEHAPDGGGRVTFTFPGTLAN